MNSVKVQFLENNLQFLNLVIQHLNVGIVFSNLIFKTEFKICLY